MLEKTPSALGRALRGVRAGADHIVSARPELADLITFEVEIRGLEAEDRLPGRMTADGEGLSPALAWRGAPAGVKAVAVVIEDADSPTPSPIMHLCAVAPLEPAGAEGGVPEGAFSREDHTQPFICGKNSFGASAYLPPDPPTGHGDHAYIVQVFALSGAPALSKGFSKKELISALDALALARAGARAVYGRPGS